MGGNKMISWLWLLLFIPIGLICMLLGTMMSSAGQSDDTAKIMWLQDILQECKELFDVTFAGDTKCNLRKKLEALQEDGE
jgi:hypothetical protein